GVRGRIALADFCSTGFANQPTKCREHRRLRRSQMVEFALTSRYAVFRRGFFVEVDLCTFPEA
ncbi:hypothetical protein NNO07_12915, partial [Pseudomonas resinovorans]